MLDSMQGDPPQSGSHAGPNTRCVWHVFPSALHVFRTIPTLGASMTQKARDTCAIVL